MQNLSRLSWFPDILGHLILKLIVYMHTKLKSVMYGYFPMSVVMQHADNVAKGRKFSPITDRRPINNVRNRRKSGWILGEFSQSRPQRAL
jgi:hypothetical protein